ncbi:MAG: glycine/sarcosine/betaine reductase component B subunit [Acidimicrobiales bacterium]
MADDRQPPGAQGLDLLGHLVREVGFGDETRFEGGVLTVSQAEARAVMADPALADVRLSWASPGDSTRLVKVLDAVEPRTKGPGGGGIFPGFLAPALPRGRGTTTVLRGAAVVTAGHLPRAQEAMVDMSGPAAGLSPLGSIHNLVVEFTPADAPWEDVYDALRRGSLALAARLAEAALGAEPDDVVHLPALPGRRDHPDLPRVAALTNLQTQGRFKEVFVYGRSFLPAGLPTLVDPNDLVDGAVVSAQLGHPSLKNPTWAFQNHPVVGALRARHGVDLVCAGVVLSPEPVDATSKELVSAAAARLCQVAGFDAVIVTKEGGGNADADMALKMDALEDAGIPTVALFAEMAGPDGTGPSIVVPPTRATAMVSTGNYDERLELPGVETALGGDTLDVAGLPATAEVEVPTAVVYCALSPLGWGRLTCRESL